MKKKFASLIICFWALNFGFGQVLIESFNNDSQFTKNEPFFTDSNDDYFGIYDPTGVADDFDGLPTPPIGVPAYTGNTNLFLVGEDLDSNGGSATRVLTWSNLNISGYTNLNLSVDLAADAGGFDATDEIIFEVNIDGAGYTTVIAFSGTGTNTNATNGAVTLTTAFQTILANITGTGNLLDLRLSTTANAGNEEFAVDEIILDGTAPIPCTHTITSFLPTQGPEGTKVTVTGSGFTPTSTVNFNGVAASAVEYINATTLMATVPSGTTTGSISVTEASCTETGSDFTILDFIGSCSSAFSDLIISEIYDSNSGSLGYIEIYNGTGVTKNLSDYEIDRYATLGGGVTFTYTFPNLNINDGEVLIGKVSSSADAPGVTPDFSFLTSLSGFNADDRLELVLSATNTVVDDWHDDAVPGTTGFSYLRNTNITGPNPIYDASEWTSNGTEDTNNLGTYAITATGNPSITTQPLSISGCDINSLNLSVAASAGNGGTLTYQWKFNNGNTANWQDVTAAAFAPGNVIGETSNTLIINDFDLSNYQFYCEVTENGSCTIASHTATVTNILVRWDGATWIWNNGTANGTAPSLNTTVILDDNFNTATGGIEQSFSACSLIISDGVSLNIGDGDYVEVQNDLTVNNVTSGGINIEPQGAFVQINDVGLVSADNPDNLRVNKRTAPANNWYEYTYWSSPVANETITDALGISNPDTRYWFNSQNFLDATYETANNNAATIGAGIDDIDDDNNDWQTITNTSTPINNNSNLEPGIGYATTHNPAAFNCTPGPGCPDPRPGVRYTFSGLFNNGIIEPSIYRNDNERGDNNWNLIGNPYPSAIDVDDFFAVNFYSTTNPNGSSSGTIEGVVYMWSHNSPPDAANNGNQDQNFLTSDYVVINGLGTVIPSESQGTGETLPNRYIPSGQGFFVVMSDDAGPAYNPASPAIETDDVTFNNSMRVTGNNNQFFRNSSSSDNKLWLNLTSDNGVFSQVLIGYTEGATNHYDGMYYDAPRNGSTDTNAMLYTSIPNVNKPFAIQAKNPSSLTFNEVIPLGFYTSIIEATIYTLSIAQHEGNFMNTNAIYIIDRLNNSIHEISNSAYNFTSDSGDFNNRFEIVFTPEALSVNDNNVTPNEITITELPNGTTKIEVSQLHTIKTVEILDVLGRQIYYFEGTSASEIYHLSKLNHTAYVARVTLSNGQIISKKAIKQ